MLPPALDGAAVADGTGPDTKVGQFRTAGASGDRLRVRVESHREDDGLIATIGRVRNEGVEGQRTPSS